MQMEAILGLAWFFINILLLFWVYNDAENQQNAGCLWALLVFFFGIPALVVYLVLFHGAPRIRRHTKVDRNADFVYRARARHGASGFPSQAMDPVRDPVPADLDFRDPELDRLIEEGRLSDARSWLSDMQKIARELNDRKALANYAPYEARISRAARTSSGNSFIPGSRMS